MRANCIANGVPADGSYAEEPGQLPVITQGNPNLKPETSKSINLGAVYSPRLAPNGFASAFSIEADYHDIKVKNAISALDPNVTLTNCALLGDAASCALVMRTAKGFVNEIDATLQNLASIHVRTFDASLSYRSPLTGIGKFGLTANASWLLKYVVVQQNGGIGQFVIDRRGTERGSPDQAYPKFKGNTTLDWTLGDLNASVTGRYIQHVTEISLTISARSRASRTNVLGSRIYVDAQVNYTPPILDHGVDVDGRRQQPDRQGSAGLLHLQHQQLRSDHLRRARAVLLRTRSVTRWAASMRRRRPMSRRRRRPRRRR